MNDQDSPENPTRRSALACAGWIGTGVVWSLIGGIPRTAGLIGTAEAATPTGFTFLQMSDNHIGFKAGPYQDVAGTLDSAIKVAKGLPTPPAFMLHTGDISHLSKPDQFATADQINAGAGLDIHHVPGEHDMLDPGKKLYLARYGKGTKGMGWYSFDAGGVHFIGLVNVTDTTSDGLWLLGSEQIKWLADDLRAVASSTPLVVFAHVPLWTVYQKWGWGTADAPPAFALMRRFASVTVLNGHIHQILQKTEGQAIFHTALSTSFPQPAPGAAPHPGPIISLPAGEIGGYLGLRTVAFRPTHARLAATDYTLES
ncbi:MAG: metallophosphoesterase [Acidocella sp.]|nr:metallophosphoesterase [Acidocella sp.]